MRKVYGVLLIAAMLLSAACQPAQAASAPEADAQPVAAAAEPAAEAKPPVATEEPAATQSTPAPEAAQAESASRFAPLYAKMQESGVLPDMMELPKDMVADFYGVDPADCADGIYYISFDNMLADEVVLIDAVDEAAAKRIEKALTNRLAAKALEADDYAPDQYAIIKKCDVIRKDLTVAMLVSPEAKTLTELFEQFS